MNSLYRLTGTFIILFLSLLPALGQDTIPTIIDTPTVVIDTLINTIDPALLPPEDSLQSTKKEERSDKTKKVFQFFSYIKFADKAVNEFTGVEKYKPYKGKVIRSVQMQILKPYGDVEDDYSQTLKRKAQRFGNKIHFMSREWYVRADILFKEGDKVNPVLFADSERLLWGRQKFKDVRIMLYEDEETGEVDVMIYLQDKLSWVVGLGYNNRLIFGISTYNFFGQPNTFSVFTGINFNKYNLWAVGGEYKYENIRRSQVNFISNFLVEKLNRNALFSLHRNFFSIKTLWAFNAKYQYDMSTWSLTQDLRDTTTYIRTKSNYYSLWLAYAIPIHKFIPCRDDKLKLIFATKLSNHRYRYRPFLWDRFYDRIFVDQQNYRFGIGVARWDYYLARNAFYMETGEYFPRGYSVSFWAGPQFDEEYGKRTVLDLTVNWGIHMKKMGYFYPQVNFSGYVRQKKGHEMITRLRLDYVSDRVNLSKIVFYRQIFRAGTSLGNAVPEGRYINMNEHNGLRSFYAPRLKGSRTFILNTECDFFIDKRVLLTKAMTYVFCDMGWISENGRKLFSESIFQYGVGFGLRLRSADIGVPHLDMQFAFYPAGRPFGEDLFQFKIYGTNPNAIQQNNLFVEPSTF